MNSLRVDGIKEAKAREMIAKHPECKMQAICSFILSNAKRAKSLQELVSAFQPRPPMPEITKEYADRLHADILDDFRKTFGHEMIAPSEPEHDRP